MGYLIPDEYRLASDGDIQGSVSAACVLLPKNLGMPSESANKRVTRSLGAMSTCK